MQIWAEPLRLAHTRVAGARDAVQIVSQWPTAALSVCPGVRHHSLPEEQQTPPARRRRGASPPMGLGDIILYAFCAFIVGVFIFNLVDTAQTAKRKIAAKKHD